MPIYQFTCRLLCYNVKGNYTGFYNLIKMINYCINPFPNKLWFLRVCSTSLSKTLREMEKLLVTSNFSFSHSVFYPFGKFSAIFIKFEIVICKLPVWKSLKFVVWERVNSSPNDKIMDLSTSKHLQIANKYGSNGRFRYIKNRKLSGSILSFSQKVFQAFESVWVVQTRDRIVKVISIVIELL